MSTQTPLTETQALTTPCAVVDLQRVQRNVQRMQQRLASGATKLRPHVKTHKTREIARLQTADYAQGIMVSTLAEARFFADDGAGDITYGVPIGLGHIAAALQLARRVRQFAVLADHAATVEALNQAATRAGQRLDVFLKVDCGYHRAGVNPHSPDAVQLAMRLAVAPGLRLRGIVSHSGHSYACRSADQAARVGHAEAALMRDFASTLQREGVPVPCISIGSTPTLSCGGDVQGVQEVRPGNYALYDGLQARIGSCTADDIALTVLTSVIGHYPESGRMIVDAGSIAMSKDLGADDVFATTGFGALFEATSGAELAHLKLFSLSQEHGQISGCTAADYTRLPVGTVLRVAPNHACLTAAQHRHYWVADAGRMAGRWEPVQGW